MASFRAGFLRALTPIMVLLAVGLVAAPSAGAHDDLGSMTVTVAEVTADGSVDLEVGILYADDDHLAEEATVTATLTSSDGATVGPVALPRTEGARYAATVPPLPPGTWTIAIVSTEPVAEAEAVVEVLAETATTAVSTDAPTTAAETTAAPTTTAAPADPTPPPTVDAADTTATAATTEAEDSDGPSGVLIAIGAVVIVGLAVVAWRLGSKKS